MNEPKPPRVAETSVHDSPDFKKRFLDRAGVEGGALERQVGAEMPQEWQPEAPAKPTILGKMRQYISPWQAILILTSSAAAYYGPKPSTPKDSPVPITASPLAKAPMTDEQLVDGLITLVSNRALSSEVQKYLQDHPEMERLINTPTKHHKIADAGYRELTAVDGALYSWDKMVNETHFRDVGDAEVIVILINFGGRPTQMPLFRKMFSHLQHQVDKPDQDSEGWGADLADGKNS